MTEQDRPAADADAKARFRAALEAKKNRAQMQGDTPPPGGAAHQGGPRGAKRQFRRKSG